MRFSIIVPVFNVAPYLRRALDSLVNQSFQDWEAICIDDGSTDSSGTILDDYATKDKRFIVFHQQNCGVSATRRNGLNVASGDWIAWLDGDDWLDSDFLEKFSAKTEAGKLEIVWTGYTIESDRGSLRRSQEAPSDAKGHAKALLQEQIWGTLWNRIFRRSFLMDRGVNFVDNRINWVAD